MLSQLSSLNTWPPPLPLPLQETSSQQPPSVLHIRQTEGIHLASARMRESLYDIPERSWWTGIRITSNSSSSSLQSVDEFRVKIVTNDGTKVFPAWTQKSGDWTLFPFVVPARMAQELGICVQFKKILPTPTPTDASGNEQQPQMNDEIYTQRVLTYLDCSEMDPDQSLLFLDDDDKIYGYWDGIQRAYGRRETQNKPENPTPRWGTVHLRIPTTETLVVRQDWITNQFFTPISWDSCYE